MAEPNRLQSESRPNVIQDAPIPDPGAIEATGAPADQDRQPSLGRALLGLAAQIIGVLVVVAWLLPMSPPVAIGWLAVVLVMWFVRRRRRSTSTGGGLAQSVYESLSLQGDQAATELGSVLRSVMIVLGWAVGAAAVAITLAAIGANLSHDSQLLVGLAILLSFLGMLILGPIWTIRRLHRASSEQQSPQAKGRAETANRDLLLWSRSEPSSLGRETMGGLAGFIVGLGPLAVAVATVVVFGILLEYDPWWVWLAVFGPPPVIVLLAALKPNPGWQRGFVAGLVLSWVGSIILGAAVLVFIPTTAIAYLVGWRRRAPSTTDLDPRIVIAGLGAAAILNVVGWVWLFPRSQTSESGAGLPATIEIISSLPSLAEVTVGQCFRDVLAGDDPTMVLGEQIVSCAEPHRGEMIATATFPATPGASFPPGTTLDDYADRLCGSAFQEYVGIPADSSMLDWVYTTPSEETWVSDGDRWIGCWVESTPPAAPLVGSVRGTGR